jgi:Rrf2 family protein
MTWPTFPKRLQSALNGLYCLAQSGTAMRSHQIAEKMGAPRSEIAKVLQLLVWGGFVISRRGAKGGFQLARNPDQITMGDIIDFFLVHHPAAEQDGTPMRVFYETNAPCHDAFAKLTLADVAGFRPRAKRSSRSPGRAATVLNPGQQVAARKKMQ